MASPPDRRLLLASHGIGALPELIGGDVSGLKFAFVPTAAGPEAEDKEWVRTDRRQLARLGCEVSTLDLAGAGSSEVEASLRAADGVFVTGGNSFLLLRHARLSGFAEQVVELVECGELVYVGTSAGAVLAGPDLEPVEGLDDRAAAVGLDGTAALGLVDFLVLPHDGYVEARAQHDRIVEAYRDRRFVRLADDRAVLVRGDGADEVESPPLA